MVQTQGADTQPPSTSAHAALRGSSRGAVLARALSLCGQHKALLEQIEARTAKHLALEQLQAIDVAFHRAGTPGQADTGFDDVVIVAQPFRKPLQGYQGTRRRPGQPGVQLCWLPLAHQLGNILGERDGVGELGILGCKLCEQLLFRGRARL